MSRTESGFDAKRLPGYCSITWKSNERGSLVIGMPCLKDSTKDIGQGAPEEDCKYCEDERELCALNVT